MSGVAEGERRRSVRRVLLSLTRGRAPGGCRAPSLRLWLTQAGLQFLHHTHVCEAKPAERDSHGGWSPGGRSLLPAPAQPPPPLGLPTSQGPSPGWQWGPFRLWGVGLWGLLGLEDFLLRG